MKSPVYEKICIIARKITINKYDYSKVAKIT